MSTDKLFQTIVYTDSLHFPILLFRASTHCCVLCYHSLHCSCHHCPWPIFWLFSAHFSALILQCTSLWYLILLTPACSQKLPLAISFHNHIFPVFLAILMESFSSNYTFHTVFPGNRLGWELPDEGLLGCALGRYTWKEGRNEGRNEGKKESRSE